SGPGTMGLNPPPTNIPPLTITCPANITVNSTSAVGTVVFYTVTTSGGCPVGNVVSTPPSGSTFPAGAPTVTATAPAACAHFAQCTSTFTVNPLPPEYFFGQPVLPPVGSVYISPALW